MSRDWYSQKPRTRFSQEHRDQCPSIAHMIDLDQVLWLPYVPGDGCPALVAELKPESAREDFWVVTRALARLAGLPAAKIIEKANGRYKVWVAAPQTGYRPELVGDDLSILDWYERVELPYRTSAHFARVA